MGIKTQAVSSSLAYSSKYLQKMPVTKPIDESTILTPKLTLSPEISYS